MRKLLLLGETIKFSFGSPLEARLLLRARIRRRRRVMRFLYPAGASDKWRVRLYRCGIHVTGVQYRGKEDDVYH